MDTGVPRPGLLRGAGAGCAEASRHPAFGGMVTKVPIQEAGTESVSQLSMASIKFASGSSGSTSLQE